MTQWHIAEHESDESLVGALMGMDRCLSFQMLDSEDTMEDAGTIRLLISRLL